MAMTINEIRRLNLLILIDESGGKKNVFANKVDTAASYISQIFAKDESKRRDIGDDLARKIEAACGKPRGWLDTLKKTSETQLPNSTNDLHSLIKELQTDYDLGYLSENDLEILRSVANRFKASG